MIFATVGTQLGFPRLMRALDGLAPGLGEPVVAQVGEDDGVYGALDVRASMAPAEYEAAFAEARLVVGHAGIGTILTARRLGKPLVILPRRHALGEHRNDHQMATARQVAGLPGIHVAWEEEALGPLLSGGPLEAAAEVPSENLAALVGAIRDFIGR